MNYELETILGIIAKNQEAAVLGNEVNENKEVNESKEFNENEEAKKQKKRKKKWRKIFGAFGLAFLIALIPVVLNATSLQETSCRNSSWLGNYAPFMCGESYKTPSLDIAEGVLMQYYSQVGGTTAGSAYNSKITNEYKERKSIDEFTKIWSDTVWAELITKPEKIEKRFNVYRVEVRRYTSDGSTDDPMYGRMVTHERLISLRYFDGEWLIDSDTAKNRISDERITYPMATLPAPHVTYSSPLVDERNIALPLSQQKSSGGSLQILCVLNERFIDNPMLNERDSVSKWYRTPQGWLPAEATTFVETNSIPSCSIQYALEAIKN